MAAVAGVGHALPDTVVRNAEIARRLGVDEAWIASRTGTRARRALRDGERLGDLAARAGAAPLRDADVAASEVDLVLVGTTSADEMSPHAAPLVAGALGIRGAAAFDLSAACTGFLSGLATAAAFVETGRRGRRSSSAPTGSRAPWTATTAAPRCCSATGRARRWSPRTPPPPPSARSSCTPIRTAAT